MSGSDGWTADPAGNVYLSPADYRVLSEKSGISDAIIGDRGHQTLHRQTDHMERAKALGFTRRFREPKTERFPGLLVPLYRPTGEQISFQFRPLKPPLDDKGRRGQKYASPRAKPAVIDVHPVNRWEIADPSVELWITEGVKKADSLASRGICVIALSGVFNWRSTLGTLGDWEDIPLKGRKVVLCFDSDAATKPPVAKAMARLGNWLRSKGAKTVKYLVVPATGAGKAGIDDYLVAGGTLQALRDEMTTKPPEPVQFTDRFTDARLTEAFVDDALVDRYRYVPGMGWLHWTGRRWSSTADEAMTDLVRLWAVGNVQQAASAGRTDEAKSWLSVCSKGRLTAILTLAAGVEGVLTDAKELDAHPDLLNTPGGIVDLTTGDMQDHDPALLMTKLTSGNYVPGAEHADWKTALGAIPADVETWFQTRMGQAITGHADYPRVGLLRGGGENGKSAVVGSGIMRAVGDYGTVAGPGVLERVKGNGPSPDRLALRGARLVLIEEMTEGRALDVTALKQIQDTDQITARDLYGKNVTWACSHTLFITSNYLPVVNETDHGVWRRLERIEFPYRFRGPGLALEADDDKRADTGIKPRLRAGEDGQHDAIVTWLVQGAIRWYRDAASLAHPDRVENDTDDWRASADRILGYWRERLVSDPDAGIIKDELCQAFNGWPRENEHKSWARETFHPRFIEHYETRRHKVTASQTRKAEEKAKIVRPEEVVEAAEARAWASREPEPPEMPTAPRVYWGVRFRTEEDDELDQPEGGDGLEPEGSDDGPDGPLTSENVERHNHHNPSEDFHAKDSYSKVSNEVVTPVTRPAGCLCPCHKSGGHHGGHPCPCAPEAAGEPGGGVATGNGSSSASVPPRSDREQCGRSEARAREIVHKQSFRDPEGAPMKRPVRLNARGRAFWDHVTAVYELTEVETQLLAETCRTIDTVESLERAARDAESRSERLQVLREARQQRLVLGRLLGQLDLPDAHGESLPTAASRQARKAALSRWHTHSGSPGQLREVRDDGA